jgi:hypothetical protein
MTDEVNDAAEGVDKMQTLFMRAMEAREIAHMLKTQLEKDSAEIDAIIDVMADAVKQHQAKRMAEGAPGIASLSVAAACMMIMYSVWFQTVADVDEADREEQFHLLRISFMALMSDMMYPGARTDGH